MIRKKLEQLNEPMYDAFVREVKKQLAEKNITQVAAAKQIQTSQFTMNQAVNGRVDFRACYMLRLAKLLNISLDQYTGVRPKKKTIPGSKTAYAVNILDAIFEKGKPMKFEQYEKLLDAITAIKEDAK